MQEMASNITITSINRSPNTVQVQQMVSLKKLQYFVWSKNKARTAIFKLKSVQSNLVFGAYVHYTENNYVNKNTFARQTNNCSNHISNGAS